MFFNFFKNLLKMTRRSRSRWRGATERIIVRNRTIITPPSVRNRTNPKIVRTSNSSKSNYLPFQVSTKSYHPLFCPISNSRIFKKIDTPSNNRQNSSILSITQHFLKNHLINNTFKNSVYYPTVCLKNAALSIFVHDQPPLTTPNHSCPHSPTRAHF